MNDLILVIKLLSGFNMIVAIAIIIIECIRR